MTFAGAPFFPSAGGVPIPGAGGHCCVTYVWLGGDLSGDIRALTRVLDHAPTELCQVPIASCDGSCTGQASRQFSSLFLQPRALYPDPFRGAPHVLVLCDVCEAAGMSNGEASLRPLPSSTRTPCESVMRAVASQEPTFVIEQEYTILDAQSRLPLGSRQCARPLAYCGVGNGKVVGRKFADEHLQKCMAAGLKMQSLYQLDCSGQWAYRLGPCVGIQAADQLQISRYILHRLTEDHDCLVTLDPNPDPESCITRGAPVKYCTRETRSLARGEAAIAQHLAKLEARHLQHLIFYGTNTKRMDSQCIANFSSGVENREASIRIPFRVSAKSFGFYEDRRPASNMDPYLVTMMLVSTTHGIPLPMKVESQAASSSAVSITRGSVSLIESMQAYDSFDSGSAHHMGPNTPPQYCQTLGRIDQEDSMSDNHANFNCSLPPVNLENRNKRRHASSD